MQNKCMLYLRIILFLIPALLIFFGGHYALYFSVVRFFSITNSTYKFIFAGVLAFLAVSFFTSSILARFSENTFTRILYFLSASWLGLLVNLLLACGFVAIVLLIARIVDFSINGVLLASVFFIIAFFFSLYGVWNAMNPQVKEVSVAIPNLPEEWKGKKVVQLSDVHLGIVHREDFMRDIVTKIEAVNPNMVVITGDLFDGMDGDVTPLVRPLLDLKPSNGMYFITGNHETYLGVDDALLALSKTNVKVLKNEVVDVNGLKLIGINYPTLDENENVSTILDSLKEKYFGMPNILLYHAPTSIAEIKARGVNLQLSGHTHKGQLFPFGYITKLIYKGYDYGLFTEGNYSLYTTNGVGTWGPPMRTGNTPEIVVITLK
ncbi:MAG: metallophosphoesterase [Candidatus Jorgensenbacteria bacterium]|nr:metallophosphoesterase [Candidatus Jorgensenbacteria bacterium]